MCTKLTCYYIRFKDFGGSWRYCDVCRVYARQQVPCFGIERLHGGAVVGRFSRAWKYFLLERCARSRSCQLWFLTKMSDIRFVIVPSKTCSCSLLTRISEKICFAISDDAVFSEYVLATCGNDDFVKIWKLCCSFRVDITLLHQLEGHTANVMCCRFSSNGFLLASVYVLSSFLPLETVFLFMPRIFFQVWR